MIPRLLATRLVVVAVVLASSLAAQENLPLLRFAVIGDMGVGRPSQQRVADQMLAYHRLNPLEFILTVGDNIYPDGDPDLFGPNFKDIYQPLFDAGVPFHASIGNHDVDGPESEDGMVQVSDPAFGYIGEQDEYILAAGPVLPNGKRLARFICLNSVVWLRELDRGTSAELEKRRKRLDKWLSESSAYQWNFLYFHHPLYSYVKTGWLPGRGHGSAKPLRAELEDKIVGKINVVFAGHDHFYQKITPQRGVHHFVTGGGGRVRAGMRKKHPNLEYGEERLHFLAVQVSPERIDYTALSDRGKEVHAGVIPRGLSVRSAEGGGGSD